MFFPFDLTKIISESFLTNAENNTSQTVGQLPGFHFKLVEP